MRKIRSFCVFLSYYIFQFPLFKYLGKALYQFYLKQFIKKLPDVEILSIYLKGSLNSKRFVPFVSDIDLAIILPDSIQYYEWTQKLKKIYDLAFFNYLPLIGEIEIIPERHLSKYNAFYRPTHDEFYYLQGKDHFQFKEKKSNHELIDLIYCIHNYYYHKMVIDNSDHLPLTKKMRNNRLEQKISMLLGQEKEDINTLLKSKIGKFLEEIEHEKIKKTSSFISYDLLFMNCENKNFGFGFTSSNEDLSQAGITIKNVNPEVMYFINYLYSPQNKEINVLKEMKKQLILTRTFGQSINTYGQDIIEKIPLSFFISSLKEFYQAFQGTNEKIDLFFSHYDLSKDYTENEIAELSNLVFKN